MSIYRLKQLTTGREYDFSYPNEDYANSLLKIKLKDKDIFAEAMYIYSAKVKLNCDDMQIVDVLLKNKEDKLTSENRKYFDMNNSRIVKRLTELNIDNFEYAADTLKNDKEFILKLLTNAEIAKQKYKKLDSLLSSFALKAKIKYPYRLLTYAADSLKKDKNFALKILQKCGSGSGYSLKYFDDSVRNDFKIWEEALNSTDIKGVLGTISDELKADSSFWEKAIFKQIQTFCYLPENLKNDEDFAMKIISKNGSYLKYFSKSIRSNASIIAIAAKEKKENYHDLNIDFDYCKYVNLRSNYELSYPNPKNKCFNTYTRSETLATNIFNIVVVNEIIAKEALTRDTELHRWILNYASIVNGKDLTDYLKFSKNWQILKRYKEKIIVMFETENIDSDGLTNYISKLLKKYKSKIDWYFIKQVISVNYDSYDFKYQDEGGYSIRENLPKVYTHLFFDEEGYIADEFIPDDLPFMTDAFYYYGDALFADTFIEKNINK